jgi:hypothetical protein
MNEITKSSIKIETDIEFVANTILQLIEIIKLVADKPTTNVQSELIWREFIEEKINEIKRKLLK